MKLFLTPTDLDALEIHVQILLRDVPAAHASAAIAAGLGFNTAGGLRAALTGTTKSPLVRRINDAAATATLMRLTGAAPEYGTLVTRAAVTAIPGCLEPETYDEGILKALARAAEGVRESDTERDEDGLYYDAFGDVVDAISLDIEHEGKNAFDCQLSLGADYDRTIWLTDNLTRAQAILRGDYEALCATVGDVEKDWIGNYQPDDPATADHQLEEATPLDVHLAFEFADGPGTMSGEHDNQTTGHLDLHVAGALFAFSTGEARDDFVASGNGCRRSLGPDSKRREVVTVAALPRGWFIGDARPHPSCDEPGEIEEEVRRLAATDRVVRSDAIEAAILAWQPDDGVSALTDLLNDLARTDRGRMAGINLGSLPAAYGIFPRDTEGLWTMDVEGDYLVSVTGTTDDGFTVRSFESLWSDVLEDDGDFQKALAAKCAELQAAKVKRNATAS
ncbi:hypothetical protein GAY30_12805 [Azospirillum brasilense]|uniref:hypothetical protein n=1 Tax=Azospirillum brasilense TaxID=192 RepID=UPI00157B08DF|nr:hypothetical protein [Azospirillum brasilense]NUB25764.1 hypothetical protein [Azospirillum brasilense]NUB31494.1 hypothetical protein [Azospirillum brasilense]